MVSIGCYYAMLHQFKVKPQFRKTKKKLYSETDIGSQVLVAIFLVENINCTCIVVNKKKRLIFFFERRAYRRVYKLPMFVLITRKYFCDLYFLFDIL